MKYQIVALLGASVASKTVKMQSKNSYLKSPFEAYGDDVTTLSFEHKRFSARLNQVESTLNLQANKQHPKLSKKGQKNLT